MDKENAIDRQSGSVGISIRNGPVDETPKGSSTNGTAYANGTHGKRKSRDGIRVMKSYKEESGSEDDDKPLVGEIVNCKSIC